MRLFSILTLLAISLQLSATESDTLDIEMELAEYIAYLQYMDSVNATFTWQHGSIELNEGMARLDVPEGFKYLDGEQSEYVLSDLWGNIPEPSLGLLFRENEFPLDTARGYVVEISYVEDGYVSDEDAEDIDYDELLETMQSDADEENEYRASLGYEQVDIVGWAAQPYYDAAAKKLHWAKELHFEGEDTNTLNYNIRVLGRRGYLMVNAISDMEELAHFESEAPMIINSVHFNEGHRYEDFDSSMDKVAAVGIGGLIAGKVLAKAGILAKIGIFFAKFWKFLLIGIAAFFGGIKKFFTGGNKEE